MEEIFVCWGLTWLLNIWGRSFTVPACSSGTLTNELPHRNAMPQTQDITPTLSQYTDIGRTCCAIHWCGTSLWNTQLPTVLGQTQSWNPSATFHMEELNEVLVWYLQPATDLVGSGCHMQGLVHLVSHADGQPQVLLLVLQWEVRLKLAR